MKHSLAAIDVGFASLADVCETVGPVTRREFLSDLPFHPDSQQGARLRSPREAVIGCFGIRIIIPHVGIGRALSFFSCSKDRWLTVAQ
jgi:hypothetical protein